MKKRANKNRPLRAFVKSGVLTIEIGIDTLAFAQLRSPYCWSLMGPKQERPDTRFRIDDKREFAREVARALLDEEEDGSSLLAELFDTAGTDAIEGGSIAFIDLEDA